MKCLKGLIIAAFFLGFQASANAENLKIGVINIQEILQSAPEAVQIREKLQGEFKDREAEIVKLDKSIKEKADKLQRDSAVMNDAERGKLERELGTNQREMQRLQTAFREDATVRQQEEMQKLLEKIRNAINTYAKDQKFDLLIHADAAPFAADKLNVTTKVIEQMNK